MIPKLKINDDRNPMVSEIFGKAVITSVVYSLSNMLNATGATNKKQKKDPSKKAKMMSGGMANGKAHMYSAGGSVKMNPGLKALKAASPEAYNKITKS